MIVEVNLESFEYDIHSLVKAFWSQEEVQVLTPATSAVKRAQLEPEIGICVKVMQDRGEISIGQQAYLWECNPGENLSQNPVEFKLAFKRFFYETLCEYTGKTLPWGNLTGIRPTKLAYAMLEEGMTDEAIVVKLQEQHLVSEEKALLSIDIARRERELLSGIHYEGGYSLYIGIPFCPTTCLYCSFTSYAIGAYRKEVDRYVDCVIKEMEYVSKAYAHKILDTVYIGGGTPTTLEPHQLDRLLSKLKELFDFSTVKEFTVEAGRADSITREKLEVLKKHGVGRISVNPQTMKQETLDIIGRKASVEQVLEAYALAR